jgi:hypothetical protein
MLAAFLSRALGTDQWKLGDRVGVGWCGGHGEIRRRGASPTSVKLQILGISDEQ